MKTFNSILIIQTAFIGDAILTLPMIQTLKKNYPNSSIDVVVVPRTKEIFSNHYAISKIIAYDKRGKDKGILGFFRINSLLKERCYELIIVPHRSLRSVLLAWLQKPRISIGFDKSIGHNLLKKNVRYDKTAHEIKRNISLLEPLSLSIDERELPRLYPSIHDTQIVDSFLNDNGLNHQAKIIVVAPGTIWNTKRWPASRFASVCKLLSSKFEAIFLVGGKEDYGLSEEILSMVHTTNVFNAAGRLSLLQSAELIRRSRILISNDSAPMHLAVAVGTPVVAIFGATVPEFGFAPCGSRDIVLETKGLKCRPCSIHGGNTCPQKTFECMLSINPEFVLSKVMSILSKT